MITGSPISYDNRITALLVAAGEMLRWWLAEHCPQPCPAVRLDDLHCSAPLVQSMLADTERPSGEEERARRGKLYGYSVETTCRNCASISGQR